MSIRTPVFANNKIGSCTRSTVKVPRRSKRLINHSSNRNDDCRRIVGWQAAQTKKPPESGPFGALSPKARGISRGAVSLRDASRHQPSRRRPSSGARQRIVAAARRGLSGLTQRNRVLAVEIGLPVTRWRRGASRNISIYGSISPSIGWRGSPLGSLGSCAKSLTFANLRFGHECKETVTASGGAAHHVWAGLDVRAGIGRDVHRNGCVR